MLEKDVGTACHNCGAELRGRFCAACGQEDRPLTPSLREIAGEFARELFNVDNRAFRSVRRLFASPGALTADHNAGRHASWTSPARLYLTFSVLFFAVTALTDQTPFDFNVRATGSDPERAEAARRLGFASEEAMVRHIDDAIATWIPRAMFVLVPLFAALVGLVRRQSGLRYPQHLIFALHTFAVYFGVQALAMVLGYLTGNVIAMVVLNAISQTGGFVYFALALRHVYGGTLGRAFLQALVVLTAYLVASIVAFALIIGPVFFRAGL